MKSKVDIGKYLKYAGYVTIALVVWLLAVQVFAADNFYAVVHSVKTADKVGVNPTATALDFGDMSPNTAAKRYVDVENKSNSAKFVHVTMIGGIRNLITLSKNNFDLAPGAKERLEFLLTMPPSADKEHYKGRVLVFKWPKI